MLVLALLAHDLLGYGLFAQPYKVLHEFSGLDGANPWSGLVLSGSTLYGNTEEGGRASQGTVFKLNADGTGFTVLHDFGTMADDGSDPMGPLAVAGTNLYGTTYLGGRLGLGLVFKLDTDGGGFEVLHHFLPSPDGANPRGCLALDGATLYGSTRSGGDAKPFSQGTVYTVNTDGTGYKILHNFGTGYGIGDDPSGGLVLRGTTLYGTTSGWSTTGEGSMVFKLNTDGSGFEVVARTGYMPMAPVLVAGNRLYGTTVHGTGTSLGTLFTVGIDGTGYEKLCDLNMPYGGLVLCGGALLGTTTSEYGVNYGTIFTINTNGSRFTVLKSFTGIDGSGSTAGMVLCGTNLCGTTRYGGAYGKGLVFSQALPVPRILLQPQTQTAELGADVLLQVKSDPPQVTYQWFFNGTAAITGITTNSSLNLSDVQTAQGGAYSVVVCNEFGTVTSSPAILNVVPKVERRWVPAVSLTGDIGSLVELDSRDSLDPALDWKNIAQLTLTSAPQFYFDTRVPLPFQRFYRAWQSFPLSVLSTIDFHLIPALTLNGTTGGKVLVEAINQSGPIDAWFPLNIVTLTNNSQLYFDTTAPHQPRRLYRLTLLP